MASGACAASIPFGVCVLRMKGSLLSLWRGLSAPVEGPHTARILLESDVLVSRAFEKRSHSNFSHTHAEP